MFKNANINVLEEKLIKYLKGKKKVGPHWHKA